MGVEIGKAAGQQEIILGPIPPLDCDQFVTVGTDNAELRVRFVGLNGAEARDYYNADTEIKQAAITLTAGTVYTWLDILNAILTTQYTADPAIAYPSIQENIIGVEFTFSKAMNFVRPSAVTANRTNTVIRATGFTWAADTLYVRGRVG
jgi:hypothetical protein